MTLSPEQDAAVRAIVAEMLAKTLNGAGERIRSIGVQNSAKAKVLDLRDPTAAIIAAVDDARLVGDISRVTEQVRRILGMRISEIEARTTALDFAVRAGGGNHLDLAGAFYTFLTGRSDSTAADIAAIRRQAHGAERDDV